MSRPQHRQQIRTRLNRVIRQNGEIFNLTKHDSDREARLMGLVDAGSSYREKIKALLTFDHLPTSEELRARAKELCDFAKLSGCNRAMIGGPSFFIPVLEACLICEQIEPVYGFVIEKGKQQRFAGIVNSLMFEELRQCKTF